MSRPRPRLGSSECSARSLLAREGADPEPLDGYEDAAPTGLWSASLLSQTVVVDNFNSFTKKVPRLVDPGGACAKREPLDLPRGALIANSGGDSLHAATRIEADDRAALERPIR